MCRQSDCRTSQNYSALLEYGLQALISVHANFLRNMNINFVLKLEEKFIVNQSQLLKHYTGQRKLIAAYIRRDLQKTRLKLDDCINQWVFLKRHIR